MIITKDEKNSRQRGWAYIIAAIVFNIATVLSIQAILLVKTGQVGSWLQLASSCSITTFFTLVIFGSFIVSLGHKLLNLAKVTRLSEKQRHSFAYALGYMTCLTVIAGLSLMAMKFSNPESVLAWWSYGLAYIVVAFCAIIAGASFSHFYTPPHQTA